MNKYQTLATNTLLMSIGTFGSKLLVFLMVRFYTGYLTPAEYGTADLITQTANLLIPLVSLDIAEARRCFGYVAIPLAALIAFSRLYLYVHFPSDVLAGAILGVVIGAMAYSWGGKALEKLEKR